MFVLRTHYSLYSSIQMRCKNWKVYIIIMCDYALYLLFTKHGRISFNFRYLCTILGFTQNYARFFWGDFWFMYNVICTLEHTRYTSVMPLIPLCLKGNLNLPPTPSILSLPHPPSLLYPLICDTYDILYHIWKMLWRTSKSN